MISWDVPICVIKLSSQHANMTADGLIKSKFSSGINYYVVYFSRFYVSRLQEVYMCPQGIVHPVVSASVLTWFIRNINY